MEKKKKESIKHLRSDFPYRKENADKDVMAGNKGKSKDGDFLRSHEWG